MTVKDSTFTGQDGSGLAVRLYHPKDFISMDDPTLDYRLEIWIAIADIDDDPAAGSLQATDSPFRSMADTRGIGLVSAGTGHFVNDVFKTTDNDGSALVYASDCHRQAVVGAVERCQGE